MAIVREADWKTKLSEEWLAAHGFTKDDEGGGVWQLWNEEFPLFIKRADSVPQVWVAEIDGTPWPIDIRVCGQVRDLCRALECPCADPVDAIQPKMNAIMYYLTKGAARDSYHDFLEGLGITDEDYDEIKRIWLERLGVKPYV